MTVFQEGKQSFLLNFSENLVSHHKLFYTNV